MSNVVVTFERSNARNCFLARKQGVKNQERNSNQKFFIYEAHYGSNLLAFFSLPADVGEIKNGDRVTINHHYADKLGIKDSEQVILKVLANSSHTIAQRVHVEPHSPDDWQILEKNVDHVEHCLLDQVRVIWKGQELPIWVESIVIYIRVVHVEPQKTFVLLDNTTTVEVLPKMRSADSDALVHHPPSLKIPRRQDTQDLTGNTPPLSGNSSPYTASPVEAKPPEKSKRKTFPSKAKRYTRSDPFLQNNDYRKSVLPRHTDKQGWSKFVGMLSSLFPRESTILPIDFNYEKTEDKLPDIPNVPEDNLVYRIQDADLNSVKSTNQRRYSLMFGETDLDITSDTAQTLLQPSTIYVSSHDLAGRQLGDSIEASLPKVFYAELRKLASPQDREKAQLEKDKNKQSQQSVPEEGSRIRCIVRVVTVDRSAGVTYLPWEQAALTVLSELGIVSGHAIVPRLLRRQLRLDATGCVWVKTVKVSFSLPNALILYPLSVVPRWVDNKLLIQGFLQWLSSVTDDSHPLVIFHGMLVKFRIDQETYIETQVFLDSGINSAALLQRSDCQLITVTVEREIKDEQQVAGVLTPMLAYRKLDDFDFKPPQEKLHHLGGIAELTGPALKHLNACLGIRPLPHQLFYDRPGLNHGLLLLTGPKGSGKSSLAHALCNAVSLPPTLAYVCILDCKPLRGKRVETIRSLFEVAFDESAWRQPSVLLLDDVDVIAPAPSNPATEISPEALYAAKVAQILEGLIKFEMRNFTRLAVIITSQSRSSLHPSIVASRGLHFVQHVTAIKSPDKYSRGTQHCCSKQTLISLDVENIAGRTEGFVARDLQVLINRALHHRLSSCPTAEAADVQLYQEDFDIALSGFKPLAIRNVPLHTSGDLGWEDIGGLEEVKKALVETLQWPSKYPKLFASCPLRMRSGLLLYGPPGTGKTLLAGAVAKECGLNFISIKGPELLSKYIGASEQSVRDLFHRAQSARPCILFFDEFDSLAPKRGHDSTGVTDRVVNQLLTQLDGVEGLQGVYVLAATSRPDLIDPALLRPGRLDKCLYCGIPSKEDRHAILKALTSKMCLGNDVCLKEVADICEYFTGADFKALLYNAQLQAIHEYTDAEKALGSSIVRIKSSIDICNPVMKKAISISAKRTPSSSTTSSPNLHVSASGDTIFQFPPQEDMVFGTITSISEALPSPPGPRGDAPICAQVARPLNHMSPDMRASPPTQLQPDENNKWMSHHKRKTVTFFPKMGAAPAILSPEDEARFLSMVETIHRRQDQVSERTNLNQRRSSNVLAKPSVLIPVSHKHLMTAAASLRPSVSSTERARYQGIYNNFVSGRQGDFSTGDIVEGLRATLA